MKPEYGMMWSLFFSPLVGAIFWTINWMRMGRRQHIWWTWASAVLLMLLWYIPGVDLMNPWPAVIPFLIWPMVLYLLQRELLQARTAIGPFVIAMVLVLLNIICYAAVQVALPNLPTA
ncbi:MAG: hypothetical protein K6T83_22360 [Alicyclobacillus sp.]|nr:hypothetical protein [Alicyclobacillus sp.]